MKLGLNIPQHHHNCNISTPHFHRTRARVSRKRRDLPKVPALGRPDEEAATTQFVITLPASWSRRKAGVGALADEISKQEYALSRLVNQAYAACWRPSGVHMESVNPDFL